jgi:sugar lactone lactonase YvrE
MKTPAASQSLSLRSLITLTLPTLDQKPGPLHTILQDEGNLYYSDEINHSVVSLTERGEVRWHKSKRGKEPGEFNYPKGIDVGWINERVHKTRCVAVCDAWNRRIQFFDSDGGFLTIWDRAGDIPFNDPVDIRFIETKDGAGSSNPCWLILDRGHGCIFGLDMIGTLLFRVGRCFPDNLETLWPKPGDSPVSSASSTDRLSACLPYDPLFVPSRIFGITHEALFIWEPKSRRLKQSVSGNLLPVWIDLPPGAEWIAADESGLLYFDRSAGLLGSFDIEAEGWQSVPIEGALVPSGRNSREVWAQDNSCIRHWSCAFGEQKEEGKAQSWVLCGLTYEIERSLNKEFASADLTRLLASVNRLRELSSGMLEFSEDNWTDSVFIEKARENLKSASSAIREGVFRIKELAHTVFLGILKIQALKSIYCEKEDLRYFNQALARVQAVMKSLRQFLEEMILFKDDWFIAAIALAPNIADLSKNQKLLMQEHDGALHSAISELTKRICCLSFFNELDKEPINSGIENLLEHGFAFEKHRVPIIHSKSSHLREIDRIFVGDASNSSCAGPAVICFRTGIGFLVSLYNSCQIMQLSESGKVLGCLKLPDVSEKKLGNPQGIAVDDKGRIWVSIPSENRIEIIDPAKRQRHSLEEMAGNSPCLNWPIGIYKAFDERMLIADAMNNRILITDANGQISTLVGGQGKHPGELRHPIAFCGSGENAEFWAVEIRNHRLQRFNLDGQFLGEIGGFGLGKGHFVLPDSAAIFDDGLLAVSQWQFSRAVKLFSKDGNELETLQVDYSPWGILAHKSILLVCEGLGNHIRIYERI